MSEWLGPILSGYLGERQRIVDDNRRDAELASAREGRVFEALINSPDPDIQAMALTGLMENAQTGKPAKGWQGWFGQQQKNPAFARIKELIATPVQEEQAIPGLPSRQIGGGAALPGGIGAQPIAGQLGLPPAPPGNMAGGQIQPPLAEPPGPPPAAMSAGNRVQVGQPPPPPLSWTAASGSQGGGTQMVSRPRQVFRTPEQEQDLAISGDVRRQAALGPARVAEQDLLAEGNARRILKYGGTTADVKSGLLAEMGVRPGTNAGMTWAEGEIVDDPSMPQGKAQIMYLRADPTQQMRLPAQPRTGMSSRAVNTREAIAADMFGDQFPGADPRSIIQQLKPQQLDQVLRAEIARAGEMAGATTAGRGAAAADMPLSTQQSFQAITELTQQWEKADKPARELRRQVQIMESGLKAAQQGNTAAGAQAVLVTFQKILDPTSVVRESEYARSASGQSLINRMEGFMERLSQGGAGIPVAELQGFADLARQFTAGADEHATQQRDIVTRRATAYKLDPSLIFGGAPVGSAPPGPPGGPAAGPATGPPNMVVDSQGRLMVRQPDGSLTPYR